MRLINFEEFFQLFCRAGFFIKFSKSTLNRKIIFWVNRWQQLLNTCTLRTVWRHPVKNMIQPVYLINWKGKVHVPRYRYTENTIQLLVISELAYWRHLVDLPTGYGQLVLVHGVQQAGQLSLVPASPHQKYKYSVVAITSVVEPFHL